MARKSIITDAGHGGEDFVTLISRIPLKTFYRMIQSVQSDLSPHEARALCEAFKGIKG